MGGGLPLPEMGKQEVQILKGETLKFLVTSSTLERLSLKGLVMPKGMTKRTLDMSGVRPPSSKFVLMTF